MTTKSTTYTTKGPVRGGCGHAHRTLRAALACLRADRRGCERVRGYSDRDVYHTDGSPLTLDEYRQVDQGD